MAEQFHYRSNKDDRNAGTENSWTWTFHQASLKGTNSLLSRQTRVSPPLRTSRPPVKFPIEFHREIEECNWKSNLSPHPRSHSPLKCWGMNRLTCSPFDPCDCYLKKKKWFCFFFFFRNNLFVFCSTRYLLFIRVTFCRCEFFFYLKRCWQILFSFFFFIFSPRLIYHVS